MATETRHSQGSPLDGQPLGTKADAWCATLAAGSTCGWCAIPVTNVMPPRLHGPDADAGGISI
eukprot:887628-Pyramimonas_sp.AAC.1